MFDMKREVNRRFLTAFLAAIALTFAMPIVADATEIPASSATDCNRFMMDFTMPGSDHLRIRRAG